MNTGSSTDPESLFAPFHARGIPVGQVYGATETGPVSIYLRAEDAIRKVGSAGKAAVHAEIRLVDADGRDVAPGEVGEILRARAEPDAGLLEGPRQPRRSATAGSTPATSRASTTRATTGSSAAPRT